MKNYAAQSYIAFSAAALALLAAAYITASQSLTLPPDFPTFNIARDWPAIMHLALSGAWLIAGTLQLSTALRRSANPSNHGFELFVLWPLFILSAASFALSLEQFTATTPTLPEARLLIIPAIAGAILLLTLIRQSEGQAHGKQSSVELATDMAFWFLRGLLIGAALVYWAALKLWVIDGKHLTIENLQSLLPL